MEKKKSDSLTVLLVDDEKELVDVIVTDYRMPIMNGGQFFTLIKSSRIVSQIPILFNRSQVREVDAQILGAFIGATKDIYNRSPWLAARPVS